MSNSDENDLTDRFLELEGKTLEEVHEDNPDPPEEYGQADPQLVMEFVDDITWLWSVESANEHIKFNGETLDIQK